MKINKKIGLKIAALGFGVTGIAGIAISSAASLSMGTGALGAGNVAVASCQPSGTPIPVTYTTTYVAASSSYTVSAIKLGAVNAACIGQQVKATLSGASNASIAEVTGTVTAAGTLTIAVPGSIAANSVTGTAVAIYN